MIVLPAMLSLEEAISASTGWPSWALRTLTTLGVLTLGVVSTETIISARRSAKASGDSKESIPAGFRWFQLQYLSVYLTIMLADWLQGTNMYTLYDGYGVDIGSLFLTGFLSSAVFGTFLGIYVDKLGRRNGCIIFCVLEVIINVLEHVNNFPLLLFGRVLGGMTTSILFSAFESWMVTEHRKRKFPDSLLQSTFTFASAGNGLVAIKAGVIAQIAADISGDIGPFQLAIALTVVTLGMVYFWPENTGDANEITDIATGFKKAMSLIRKSPAMLCLGLSQAFFEGAVYTFVFMWVPNMQLVAGTKAIPYGLIFSCFMLSMTLGGALSGLLLPFFGGHGMCLVAYALSACAMATPIFFFDFWPVFIAFLSLECFLGIFNAGGGLLRSEYYPEDMQASLMNVFRIPLNCLVVLGTKLTSWSGADVPSLQNVFAVVVSMHLIALGFQFALIFLKKDTISAAAKKADSSRKGKSPATRSTSRGKSPKVKASRDSTTPKKKK
ncbi:unnamed protein product [Amoebophrya sp. A25]|nr:unnamed protein product [Amoebophrya sp. A25]|eukprot:GSA25T00004291001.1